MRHLWPLVVCVVATVACSREERATASHDAATSVPAVCTRIGQSCEFAPGKLGSCVARDDCADPAGCFVCQSQH